MNRLNRTFFQRPPEQVAPELLGKIVVHKTEQSTLKVKITEVEAYLYENDESDFEIDTLERVGISKSKELVLRFFIKNSKYLSR